MQCGGGIPRCPPIILTMWYSHICLLSFWIMTDIDNKILWKWYCSICLGLLNCSLWEMRSVMLRGHRSPREKPRVGNGGLIIASAYYSALWVKSFQSTYILHLRSGLQWLPTSDWVPSRNTLVKPRPNACLRETLRDNKYLFLLSHQCWGNLLHRNGELIIQAGRLEGWLWAY